MQKIRALIFLIIVTRSAWLFSQNDSLSNNKDLSKLCEVQMRDGTSYKGFIEKQTDSLIFMKSSHGVQLVIPKRSVSSIEILKGIAVHDTIHGLKIHPQKISDYYYTTTSNAFLFKKGEIYGSASYLGFGNVNYAPTRNFSLGVTTSVIGVPMGIHAKANWELTQKLYVGLEGVAGSMMYLNPKSYGMGGVLKVTYGDEIKNFTLYAGYFDAEQWVLPRKRGKGGRPPARAGNYYISNSSGFAGFAFSVPVSGRAHFVADAFAYPLVSVYSASFGLRGTSKQKISWVGGFEFIKNVIPLINRVFVVPYFGFSFRL